MAQNPMLASWARGIWEQAMEAPNGLRLTYDTYRAAASARFALYTARNINRDENKEIFSKDDPMWGRSEWDAFRVALKEVGEAISSPPHYELVITRHDTPGNAPKEIEQL